MKCIRKPTAYWTTCRCDYCGPEQARKIKHRDVYGYTRPSGQDAWERFLGWVEAGYSWAWIADAAGLNASSLDTAYFKYLQSGQPAQFGHYYSGKILAADIDTGTRGSCPARGIRRRLQALARIGWGVVALSQECGVPFTTIACIQRGDVDAVTADNAHPIRAMYDRLENQPRKSTQAVARAERLGWAAPAAWDDIDHDDEPQLPSDASKGDRTLEDYEWLISTGHSRAEALERLGVTYDAITAHRKRRKQKAEREKKKVEAA